MEYTITSGKKVKVKLDPHTTLALNAYKALKSKEKQLLKAQVEHTKWVLNIPKEDMEHYIAITDEMDKR